MNPVTSGLAPATVPGYSGFDKSFKNLLSAKVGTLVPVLLDPVIAGTRVNLADALSVKMPPLASDTYMNCDLRLEAFFVPANSLYGGFDDFITKRDVQRVSQATSPVDSAFSKARMPWLPFAHLLREDRIDFLKPGTLADYIGIKDLAMQPAAEDQDYMPRINPLPFLAYHRVWDRFYRNSLVQKPIFSKYGFPADPSSAAGTAHRLNVGNLPYAEFCESDPAFAGCIGVSQSSMFDNYGIFESFVDGKTLFDLRQRNFGADYFTTATPTVQKGDPSAIDIKVDVESGEGEVTIAAVRAANVLQLFRERNNMVSDNIHSYNQAHYGVSKSGYGESLPVCLGSQVVDVYSDPIDQSAPFGTADNNNPFGQSVGATYGNAHGEGRGSLIDSFEAPSYGYIMVMASLCPKATYSTGIDRHLLELVNGEGVSDIPDPILQQAGPQPVYTFELDADAIASVSESSPEAWRATFGYQQRYAHYMEKQNQLHGLFRDNESLQSFALQRSFHGGAQNIGTEFLEIPTDFMDQVTAVDEAISDYGYWLDIFFDYKVSMPLNAFSIPSLENPQGHTEFIRKPGYTL